MIFRIPTWLEDNALCEKCPNTEFFPVLIFPHSDSIRRDTSYLSVFSPNEGNNGPEKTPYLDTFHAVMCVFLNRSKTLHWQHFFEKLEEAETHCLHLCQYKTILPHPKEQHLPFKQTRTNIIFSFGYQSCTWPRSGPFCWQNPCSGCNSGIDLVVVLQYTFFQLCSNTKQIS